MGITLLISVFHGCGSGSQTEEQQETRAVPVEALALQSGSIQEVYSYTGSIEAWRKLDVLPEVGGKVSRIYVEIGDLVKKDQVLAELDQETFSLLLEQAEAALAVARSSLNDAQKNYDRGMDLIEKGSMSQQQFEKIALAYDASKSQYQQAEAALDLAKWQVKVSVMKAPFDGVVTARWLDEGDQINPQMPSSPGVVSVMDLSQVKIRIAAPEQEITRIFKDQPVKVTLDVYADRVFDGRIYAVNAAANPATRTFEVQIRVPNPERALKAGMFADVDVIVREKSGTLVIPADAVLGIETDRHVYVVENGQANRRNVTLGIIQDVYVEVLEGLAVGDTLIVVGQQMLQHGTPVALAGGE
jgi:membrane fusion protein (multidrug efflux system)